MPTSVIESTEKSQEELDFNLILYRQIEALANHASTIFLNPPYTNKLITFKIGVDILETLLIGHLDDKYKNEIAAIETGIAGLAAQNVGEDKTYFIAVKTKFEALMKLMLRLGFLPPKKVKTKMGD